MRLIDANALERRIMMMPDDELCEDCCYNVVNAIHQVPTISVKPKREWENYNLARTQVNAKCPKCGKKIWRRNDIVRASYPAQYQYECECGWVGYV